MQEKQSLCDKEKRKEAEKELVQSEARWRSLVENAPNFITIVGPDRKIQYINHPREGINLEDVIGRNVFDFISSDYRKIAAESLDGVFETGRPGFCESMAVGPHGRLSWYENSLGPIIIDGKVTAVTIIASDVTRRKEIEEELRRQNIDMKRAQGISQVGSWEWDVCTNSFRWSEEMFRILDFDPERFTATHEDWNKVNYHPDDLEIIKEATENYRYRQTPVRTEYRIIRRDGSIRWLVGEGETERDESGTIIRLYGTVQDITERKQQDTALRESEEKFRKAFDNANIGMVLVSPDGAYLRVNRSFCQMLGYTRSELEELSFRDVTLPRDIQMSDDLFEGIRAGEISSTTNIEKTYLHKDGSEVRAHVVSSLIRDDDGQARYFITHIQDITERKQIENRIRSALDEKEVLLREIHHRVKNNMQVICSLLQLQANVTDNEAFQDALADSQNRVMAMAAVHEILFSSENVALIELEHLVSRLVSNISQAFRGYKGHIDFHTDVINVPIQIEQAVPLALVINELVTNSLKHAFPEGRPGKICVSANINPDKYLEIGVWDDGVGMPGSVDLKKPATLGLRLIRTIVMDQLDGDVQAVMGDGTKYTIVFRLL